jgi:hypothetical protein
MRSNCLVDRTLFDLLCIRSSFVEHEEEGEEEEADEEEEAENACSPSPCMLILMIQD